MDELREILEGEARELASRVLSEPQRTTLDRSTEADVSVGWAVKNVGSRGSTRLTNDR
jgi:hypothetical protein